MAVANVTGLPEVVSLGNAVENRYSYTANEVIAVGDLIRVTSAGTIKLAGLTSGTSGPLHGISLAVGAVGGVVCPVLLFATDTIFSMPCEDDSNPDDYPAGTGFQLDDASVTGVWAIEDVSTNAVVLAVDTAKTGMPWTDRTGSFAPVDGVDNNGARVLCRVTQANLDAHAA